MYESPTNRRRGRALLQTFFGEPSRCGCAASLCIVCEVDGGECESMIVDGCLEGVRAYVEETAAHHRKLQSPLMYVPRKGASPTCCTMPLEEEASE